MDESASAKVGGQHCDRSAAAARVLVCDDDRLVLVTLASALRGAGYEVIEADNGDDAILLARQHRPDLALLDIRMDGKSGLDVAAYLRDYVGTPFMFLSAFSDEAFIRQARECGALDYLVKPVDFDRIAPAVAAALRANRSRVEPDAAPGTAAAQPATRSPARCDAARLIALGILMERFTLSLAGAQARLAMLARRTGRAESQVAREMVRNHDALNAAGSPEAEGFSDGLPGHASSARVARGPSSG